MLYSELVHAKALTCGHYGARLAVNAAEYPCALQLGGDEPIAMGEAASLAEEGGFAEINLNVGCPSPRAVDSSFGLCMMENAQLTAECVAACCSHVRIPVTVKCRLGSRLDYSFEEFLRFIDLLSEAGCHCFIVHARRADLQSFDTRQNRSQIPLEYEQVYRLKSLRPQLEIIVNGGINGFAEADNHLLHVDGVMLGRSLYKNIYLLAEADAHFYGDSQAVPTRRQVVEAMIPYIEAGLAERGSLCHYVRHLLGLYQGLPKARLWRRFLAEHAYKEGCGTEVLRQALDLMDE